MDFWFTFILPNQRILQSHNTQAIRQLILRDYTNRSDLNQTVCFAEIKRNPAKIQISSLKEKAKVFLSFNPALENYQTLFLGLSTEELGSDKKLPFET